MDFQFKIFGKIQKPVAEVFDAVYNPEKLSQYFTTGGASAPLEAGNTVTWDFADFPGAFPVHVKKCERNAKIELTWKAMDGDYETLVEFFFTPLDEQTTKVEIQESGWRNTSEGLKSSYMNCFGWSQMLCCMKVWLEQGINLRANFF